MMMRAPRWRCSRTVSRSDVVSVADSGDAVAVIYL